MKGIIHREKVYPATFKVKEYEKQRSKVLAKLRENRRAQTHWNELSELLQAFSYKKKERVKKEFSTFFS